MSDHSGVETLSAEAFEAEFANRLAEPTHLGRIAFAIGDMDARINAYGPQLSPAEQCALIDEREDYRTRYNQVLNDQGTDRFATRPPGRVGRFIGDILGVQYRAPSTQDNDL